MLLRKRKPQKEKVTQYVESLYRYTRARARAHARIRTYRHNRHSPNELLSGRVNAQLSVLAVGASSGSRTVNQ